MTAAGAELGQSLDSAPPTVERAAHVALPWLASYCAVDLLDEDGVVRRAAFARVDGAPDDLPLDPYAPRGSAAVIRAGRLRDPGWRRWWVTSDGWLVHDSALLRGCCGGSVGGCMNACRSGRAWGCRVRCAWCMLMGLSFRPRRIVAVASELARRAARRASTTRGCSSKAQEAEAQGRVSRDAGPRAAQPAGRGGAGHDECGAPSADPEVLRRGVVARQGGRLGRLVDDLFDVARMTRGKVLAESALRSNCTTAGRGRWSSTCPLSKERVGTC